MTTRCPHCNQEISPNAKACPGCRMPVQETVDWEAERDDFNYQAFLEREFGHSASPKPHHLSWKWWITGIILFLCFLALALRGW
ncbi:MAG: hypothetical protein AAF191_12950 [Verrucomicrobiota bacterium]